MNIYGSEKIRKMTSSIFQEVVDKKHMALMNGKDVIDLSIGSPDFQPPTFVMETLAKYSMDPGKYGYTLKGIAEFNEAVKYFYSQRYSVELDEKTEVLQLMGSQDGLAHLATAIVDPGDYVLVPDPGYPIYEASVTIAGGEIYPMPLLEENKFLPVLNEIPDEVLRKTKMMILSYPGNPVTALADRNFFEEVVEFASVHNILVVHDFAYSELIYDGNPQISFLSVPGAKEVGIEFNSLSKTFNMAGCRIGYVAGNSEVINLLASFKSHIDYGVFYPIQKAAIAALTSDFSFLEDQLKQYQARRDALVAGFRNSGWQVANSPATMFVWAKIPDGWKSREFAFKLIEEEGIVVVPGDAFGQQGEGYVRIAMVQPPERLQEAAQRVNKFLLGFPVGS
ncbi:MULTISPECIES: LL-diaminopimelate aminotransferase [unclassified Mesobacillus]|uniref:LL-diaminopimelate aminotransferase n=1 Tax=unclassified Mesobacillus TaxID=2675270 RepID=UPI00203F9370|nr:MULTISPECIES: LL-diaminopimelate aminotransferase [unclassified Mesobacillus]MCM3123037.1 LL-diaminopimelate aminotransferase [Mesobacillus sp. MER 33]MCM3233480.1 LL-diaminopimelate aminotransferase [Mesobacillus sp. MER 48]